MCIAACALWAALCPNAHAQQHGLARAQRAAQLIERGARLKTRGDAVSALSFFREAIRADPNDPRGYAELGECYLEAGAYKDALEAFQAGVRRRPDVAALWTGLARALEQLGELGRAAAALRRYATRDPAQVSVQLARGALAERRGAWSEALAAYRAARERLARDGDDPETLARTELRIQALRVLVGDLDPVRAERNCQGASALRRALAACPPAAFR